MFKRKKDSVGLPMGHAERGSNNNKAPLGLIYTRSHSRSLRMFKIPSLWSLFGYIWVAVGSLSFCYGIFALLNNKEVVELICPIHDTRCTYTVPHWAIEKYSTLLEQ